MSDKTIIKNQLSQSNELFKTRPDLSLSSENLIVMLPEEYKYFH